MGKADRNNRVEYALRGARLTKTWIRVECPFCDDDGHRDTKRSLGVSATTGYYSCFRCGTRGRLDEPPSPELAALHQAEVVEEIKTMEPPEGFCRLWKKDLFTSVSLEPAVQYLAARNVTRPLMRQLQIGCCDEGRYAGRVVVPLLDSDNVEWLGYVTRLWVKKPSRKAVGFAAMPYLYPPGMNRGRFLWNHAAVLRECNDPLIIVEGVFDAIPFYPDGVATLGKFSGEQIEALLNAKRPLVFVPDGDAWQEGWALAQRMRFEGMRAGLVKLKPRQDPDEVPRGELIQRAHESLDDPL